MHQVVSEIDSYGHETNYIYDHLGREISCLKPQDSQSFTRPEIKKTYNPLNQVVSCTDEAGFTTLYACNAYGKPTHITYPDGASELYTYYTCGWLKQKIYADGTGTVFTYDAKGRILIETSLDKDGKFLKEVSYQYKGSLLQSKKDAMGLLTTYGYDAAGRKTRETTGEGLKTTLYQYDDLGRLIQIKHLLNGDAQVENYQYDWLDRPLSKILQDAQGNIFAHETYTYDIHGNQNRKKVYQTEGIGAVYHLKYFSDGNLQFKKNPLGHSTNYFYDHYKKNIANERILSRSIVDPLGRLSQEIEDIYHRLAHKELYAQGQQISSTDYYYDSLGHLIKQCEKIMVDGQISHEYTIEWVYDARGRVISETEKPALKSTLFHYDSMGRLAKKIKTDGVELNFEYDALGRLKKMTSSDESIAYTYRYDLHDNPIAIKDLVHQSIHKRRCNLLDQLEEEQIDGLTLKYHYDALDRLIEMILPDGSSVSYQRDAYHLKKIRRFNSAGELQYEHSCQAYDLFGNLLKSHTPDGEINYSYDLLGRRVKIQSGSWESNLEQFDAAGNLLALTQKDPTGELKSFFTYDHFDHLNSESSLAKNTYKYDSIGNCIQKNDQSIKVNKLNQVKDDGTAQYTYDSNGNLIAQTNPPVTYQYDALNRLIQIKQPQVVIHMSYDSFGRCIKLQENEKVKQLVYLQNKEIGAVENGQLQEFKIVDTPDASEAVYAIELKGEIYFPLQDARNNITALKKANGEIAEWYRYSAFGQETQFPSKSTSPWRFANRRQIAGLSQFQHRFYYPHLMRWLSKDPAGFDEGPNLYAYVKNNPFYYNDPDGRFVFVIPLVAWGAGLTLTAAECLTLTYMAGAAASALTAYGAYELCKHYDISFTDSSSGYDYTVYNQEQAVQNQNEGQTRGENQPQATEKKEKFKFPKNPDDLLPELERDSRGRIYPADGLRIRPEKHPIQEGEKYNLRHHGQHYHVESLRDTTRGWRNKNNIEIIKPPGYHDGMGTGFLPGESFPGLL